MELSRRPLTASGAAQNSDGGILAETPSCWPVRFKEVLGSGRIAHRLHEALEQAFVKISIRAKA